MVSKASRSSTEVVSKLLWSLWSSSITGFSERLQSPSIYLQTSSLWKEFLSYMIPSIFSENIRSKIVFSASLWTELMEKLCSGEITATSQLPL